MRELEAMILRIVNPVGNKVKGKFAKSENLRKQVRRDYRQRLREEEAQLWGGRGYQPNKKRKAKKRELKKSKATGRKPILAKYGKTGMRLKGTYKSKNVKAWVRKDGAIRYQGEVYNSPSFAAKAAIGHKANGWRFWKYERSPGDWVLLDNLRK